MMLLREVHLRGSITAAARALSYTHSAVSQHLSLFEREVGVTLLERVGRGVRLTPAAEQLVHHADDVLNILERAEADLATSDTEVRGTLQLGAFSTVSRGAVPHAIADIAKQHPALDVRYRHVEPEAGLLLLSARRIDVLVADSYPGSSRTPDDLHVVPLMSDPIRAYLPHGKKRASLDQLRRLKWITEPSGSEAHAWALYMCRRHGFEPTIAFESPDLLFHLRMVEAGLAAAFLPDLLVRTEGATVIPTDLLGADQTRQISFICRAGAESRPAVAVCREALATALG